jgi:hypothetical protein
MKDRVKKIIDEWDPSNLLSHAPDDEYDLEIRKITELLPTLKNTDELAVVIQNVFNQCFGNDFFDYDYNIYLSIARKIMI